MTAGRDGMPAARSRYCPTCRLFRRLALASAALVALLWLFEHLAG